MTDKGGRREDGPSGGGYGNMPVPEPEDHAKGESTWEHSSARPGN